MSITVSISQFRQNIAEYLAKANDGYTVILEDEKKGQQIAQLTGKRQFNPKTFGEALQIAAGVFTSEQHPEWNTKEDVMNWVERERQTADRSF